MSMLNIEEILKEQDPATIQALEQSLAEDAPAVRKTAKLKEVHNDLLKQPFCHKRQRLVHIIICLDYQDCRWEGLCYPCFVQGIKHKMLYTPPIENIPLVKICSDTYDWHSAYNDFKELVDLGVLCL